MILFEKVKFRNTLSYGNNWTEYIFKEGIARIGGKNGNGKSTIGENIYWVLFGKPYRNVKLGQLINCINKKEMEVHLWFSINNKSYRIERGMKENYFRIYLNDVIVPIPPSTSSYQSYLEESILQLSAPLFEQLSMKSLTRSFSFFSLKKEQKREIIENLLDTSIYSQMGKNAKVKADEITKDIDSLKKDINTFNTLITQEENNLLKLKAIQKDQQAETDQRNLVLRNEILALEEDIVKNKQQIDGMVKYKTKKKELQTERSMHQDATNTFNRAKTNAESKISLVKNKVQYLQSTCGDCPNIGKMLVVDNIDELLETKKTCVEEIETLNALVKTIDRDIFKCDEVLATERGILERISYTETQIQNRNREINKPSVKVIVVDEKQLEKYKEDLLLKEEDYNEKCIQKKHYVFARTMLSDENIKAYVVGKYLPAINTYLNLYLQKFGSEIIFKFNEEFEEVIDSRHKEGFSYESFSEGQKRKIDMAILFTFIEFLDCKFGDVSNLLMLDEVSSTLDSDNENVLYGILKELADQRHKCIITISHSGNVEAERVDHSYEVSMENGFSKLTKVE